MTRADLRVAVPESGFETDPGTGAGRVWTSVLARLQARGTRIEPLIPPPPWPTPWRRRPSPDVWLVPTATGKIRVKQPVVTVVHGAAWTTESSFFDWVPRPYAEAVIAATEATVMSATLAIVPSEYTRSGLIDACAVAPEEVFVVPHGVDSAVFHPARDGGRELVATASGTRRPYVLFASIPSIAQKNLAALKQAMALLATRGREHALVIAGGHGDETAEERAEVLAEPSGMEGRIVWVGHADDDRLATLMAGCDAFCLPSMFESFGLTALEAMACGAPVVVSNRGALPEVVGDAALTAEPEAEALAVALDRVLGDADLASRLRRAGRARAEEMTWERTADGWLEVLRRAARGP